MTKWLLAISLVAGCGSDCEKLRKKICEGADEASCKAMREEFDTKFLRGPNGEKMSGDEAEVGCKMILNDDVAVKRLVERSREKLKNKQ